MNSCPPTPTPWRAPRDADHGADPAPAPESSRHREACADAADQKFIADYLLTGRFTASGGGIFYENGESIFATDNPEAVEPPVASTRDDPPSGNLTAAKTTKWGLDTLITDEAIARLGINPVDRGLQRLANQTIKYIDTVAWGVIASKVTDTIAATGAWAASVPNVVQTLLNVQADRQNLALGLNLDTVALSAVQYAKVIGLFMTANVLPREAGNPLIEGNAAGQPARLHLGHVAGHQRIEPLGVRPEPARRHGGRGSRLPGYVRSNGVGIEVKTIREDHNDRYRVRARRVTVPVVIEPHAGIAITGTGL
jgi:hypothetical protein